MPDRNYTEDKKFEKLDFSETALPAGDYENCIFSNCNFSNGDLYEIRFVECEFIGSNLSQVRLTKTSLKDIKFRDCKMLGLYFESCDKFLLSVDFENCILNLSSFNSLKLKKTRFKNCTLHEVDFTDADLSGSSFENSDLTNAIFRNTILEKVDFQTAFNYSIDPELNRIKKAVFSVSGIAGLLNKYDIEIK